MSTRHHNQLPTEACEEVTELELGILDSDMRQADAKRE
jgi:hypothetical protein